jgi:hypothetical protein
MKRYDLMCDGHYANNAVEDDDGDWVPSSKAKELYDALDIAAHVLSFHKDETWSANNAYENAIKALKSAMESGL